ncbi:MAG: PAS domain S-box protein, partial [Spirochaetales bacterium]|nr:PAS domain S-box protein [Spirochaetales bacterium]
TIDMAIYKNEMQKKIVENENLLKTTLENIEDAVINVGKDGNIKYLNSTAEEMLKIKKRQAKFSRIDKIGIIWKRIDGKELVHPFLKCRKTKILKNEYKLINIASGEILEIECSVNPLVDHKKNIVGYVYLMQDIAERKKNYEIQKRLATIVETSKDAIIWSDPNGIIENWNKGAEELFGYTFKDVKNKNLSILTPDNVPDELPEKIEKMKNGEIVSHYECLRKTKTGNVVNISVAPSSIRNIKNDMIGISFIVRDVTEKKKLEKEITEVEEKERKRIGQNLHDSLGQQLTGILLNIKTIEKMLEKRMTSAELIQVQNTEELVKDAIKQTRSLAKNLIAVTLKNEGLPLALEDLATFARDVYKREIITDIDEEITDIDEITENQLYHIAQEAINNSVKYSESLKIFLGLTVAQKELVLTIKDKGIGIKENKTNGIGLNIMKYRAGLVNGTLKIHSEENEGTLIMCRVPLM